MKCIVIIEKVSIELMGREYKFGGGSFYGWGGMNEFLAARGDPPLSPQ